MTRASYTIACSMHASRQSNLKGHLAMSKPCAMFLSACGVWVLSTAVAWCDAPQKAPQYKALIVDGQNNHNWKGTTPILKKHLEDTGLFTVNVATSPAKGQDMSGFKPDFAAYSVVVSNYNGEAW